jgi:hypothetical protein
MNRRAFLALSASIPLASLPVPAPAYDPHVIAYATLIAATRAKCAVFARGRAPANAPTVAAMQRAWDPVYAYQQKTGVEFRAVNGRVRPDIEAAIKALEPDFWAKPTPRGHDWRRFA